MDTENGFDQLVRQAQLGDRVSLDRLAEGARQRLYAYIYRLTLNRAIRKELSETIVGAMARLRLTHRNVLMLRCFEQMSFSEIGEIMGCKELRARVLFFRTRHSLSRQLSRRGLGKGLLVTALGVFGLLTAPADSAPAGSITAASLNVGVVAAIVGKAGTPSGAAVVVTIAGFTLTLTMEHFLVFAFFFGLAAISVLVGLYWD